MATLTLPGAGMASEASGPLLSEGEGEFLVSTESIINIPGFCRPLCLYYFFTLKWFEGKVLERKMRLKKNSLLYGCGYVFILKQERALFEEHSTKWGFLAYVGHPAS